MFVDTHSHLYLPEFGENVTERRAVVDRALEVGVDKLIFPNVDTATIEPMHELADLFPGHVFTAMGLHPTEVHEDWKDRLDHILSLFDSGRSYVAVGEVGIDLYWDKTFTNEQMLAFERQVIMAVESNLPLIIHCREGLDQTLEVLSGFKSVAAVFHSFGGSPEDVDKIRRVGDYYFGINGVVTFKNSKLAPALNEITIDRILLETDSPYLTPAPHRGKRNESSYIPFIAAKIAEILSISSDKVAQLTTVNANTLFKLTN